MVLIMIESLRSDSSQCLNVIGGRSLVKCTQLPYGNTLTGLQSYDHQAYKDFPCLLDSQ